MRFLTLADCREWCQHEDGPLDADGFPLGPHHEAYHAKTSVPREFTAMLPFCRALERSLMPRRACLLWVTATGIWESNTNWQLYYRVRQSYGDQQLIDVAPGHLFLDYESADLVSFIEMTTLFGFDAHLITDSTGYSRAFVSHDEFVEFAADDALLVQEFVALTSR